MTNTEHLEIFNQGIEVWNNWRTEHIDVQPNLSSANLRKVNVRGANLRSVDLRHANLSHVDLGSTDLTSANLSGASLNGSSLTSALLTNAIIFGAHLNRADLRWADLSNAILTCADLSYADLTSANLSGACFTQVELAYTSFGDVDLSQVKELEMATHNAPSTLGIDAIYKSSGKIPEVFLRGCGLSDWQIECVKLYQPNLSNEEITNILYQIHDLRVHQVIQINPLFIAYNHKDTLFVDEMENYLNEKGIRFWRDIHHGTSGRLERQIDRAIRLNPTVLLILSAHSVESDWVQHEARLARRLELETKRDVLCPIALDDSWKDCGWPERLREQIMEYNILDFSDWNDKNSFRQLFYRLLDGLDLFYK